MQITLPIKPNSTVYAVNAKEKTMKTFEVGEEYRLNRYLNLYSVPVIQISYPVREHNQGFLVFYSYDEGKTFKYNNNTEDFASINKEEVTERLMGIM